MSDRVNLEYRGKKYYRISDLAKDYNLPTQLVSSRWHAGHRNPADLVADGRLHTVSGAHIILYKNQKFLSAKEFCAKYNLGYQKVLYLMKKGITDPEELIKEGSIKKDPLQEMLADDNHDEKEKTKLINDSGLLTLKQVSKMTGVPATELNKQVQHLIKGRAKDNGLGFDFEDLEKVELPELEEKIKVKNGTYVVNYAFKKDAVTHILNRINIIKEKGMIQLPFPFEKYYFDSEDSTLWFYGAKKIKTFQIKIQKGSQSFELVPNDNFGKKHVVKFKLDEIEDMINNPDILADDLMTRTDISEKYHFSYSRNLRDVLPKAHKRYSATQYTKITGWSKKEVEQTAEKYPAKFVPLQSQFSRVQKKKKLNE